LITMCCPCSETSRPCHSNGHSPRTTVELLKNGRIASNQRLSILNVAVLTHVAIDSRHVDKATEVRPQARSLSSACKSRQDCARREDIGPRDDSARLAIDLLLQPIANIHVHQSQTKVSTIQEDCKGQMTPQLSRFGSM
jgi:hypothetical protein